MLHSGPMGRRRLAGVRVASLVAVLAVLLAGCAPGVGNANLGPDPGGGFYCPNNAYEGCVNP